jgi:hypothetical protein
MTSVGQMGQSMSAGSPYSCVPPVGGSSGPAVAVVAPQQRGVGNMAPLQQTRFGAAAGSLGKCESELFYSKCSWSLSRLPHGLRHRPDHLEL